MRSRFLHHVSTSHAPSLDLFDRQGQSREKISCVDRKLPNLVTALTGSIYIDNFEAGNRLMNEPRAPHHWVVSDVLRDAQTKAFEPRTRVQKLPIASFLAIDA